MVKKVFFFLLIILSPFLYSQQINVLASVDTTDYKIGDYINYTINVSHPKNMQLIRPEIKDTLASLEVISIENPVTSEQENSVSTKFIYVFSKYDSAEVTIPSLPVKYKAKNDTSFQSVNTNPVSFTVHTLSINEAEEIKDVKEPVTIPLDWKLIALYVVIGLIIIALAVYLYKKYKKKKEAAPVEKKVVRIPAHVLALQELEQLDQKKLWQNGEVKEYHSEITEIIRRYFEKRFHLHALEMTTGEVITQLSERNGTENIKELTRDFLNNADLVKFAKYQPMHEVNEEMMIQAKEIVNSTIPVQTPRAAEVNDV